VQNTGGPYASGLVSDETGQLYAISSSTSQIIAIDRAGGKLGAARPLSQMIGLGDAAQTPSP
jgi:hypothetical protein